MPSLLASIFAVFAAGMDLEGHTGYMAVPSALVQSTNALSLSWNSHYSYDNAREDQNLTAAFSPIPFTEIVTRFAFPDLSVNTKLGVPVYSTDWASLHVAFGIQDVWGGARMFHSKYGVVTVNAGPLESSLGWGTGTEFTPHLLRSTGKNHPYSRLDGVFHGIALHLPLPQESHLDGALLEEHDGRKTRLGARLGWSLDPWTVEGLVAVPPDDPEPEFQITVQQRLPDHGRPADDRLLWGRTPVVLQVGPWAQSFVGTEVGDFDAQIAADFEAFVTPPVLGSHLTAASRVRRRITYTRNYREGKAFEKMRRAPATWWESGALAWASDASRSEGLLLQAGWTGGDWTGPMAEFRHRLRWGIHAGATSGWWYSPGWDTTTWMALPYIDWDSPKRSWFVRTDAGRYFKGDWSQRVRIGRRWGRLEAFVGALREFEHGEILAEGRLQFDLGGLEWNPGHSFLTLRPVPKVGHTLRTRVVTGDDELNWLRPDMGFVPTLLLKLRD